MEVQFEKLIKAGKNNIDSLIRWLKDAKIIDGVKMTEDKARDAFKEAPDPKNINIDTFKAGLAKMASGQKQSVDDYTKILAKEAPKFLDALQAGASAFKNAFAKK